MLHWLTWFWRMGSEAKDALDLRGPYDVMNLGVLAGLSPVRSRMLVTASADVAVRHGGAGYAAYHTAWPLALPCLTCA